MSRLPMSVMATARALPYERTVMSLRDSQLSFRSKKYRFSKENQVEKHRGGVRIKVLYFPSVLKSLANSCLPCFNYRQT